MPRLAASTVPAQAEALARRGAAADAYRLLEQGVAAGDGEAAATLADWRMAGQIVRRDIAAAQSLYGKALELGVDDAAGPFLALLASGAGNATRDWRGVLEALDGRTQDRAARRQLKLLRAMDLTEAGDPQRTAPARILHRFPHIATLPDFLSAAECRYLVDLAGPRLQPSQVVDPRSGQLIRDPVRTARAAAFPLVFEDPVVHAINRRIAAVTGTVWEQGEPVQVLSYRPGEEYKLHSDALPPGNNQRTVTVLVALNRDYAGGETRFPALDIAWRGATGEALIFGNVDRAGMPDAAARHAGCPVRRGSKFLLSRWIRERPLDLSGPPGRPF
jgi:prolyl 4-hydroxylase